MKKTYQTPTFARRESLSRVTAACMAISLTKLPNPNV